jgi:hypothetical protein
VRHLRDRTGDHDAGVAEEDVNLAEQAKSLVREVNHLLEMPHVAHNAVRVKTIAAQPRHGLFQRGLIDVGEHEPGPAAGKLGGGGQTDATRPTGDNRGASSKSVNPIHGPDAT